MGSLSDQWKKQASNAIKNLLLATKDSENAVKNAVEALEIGDLSISDVSNYEHDGDLIDAIEEAYRGAKSSVDVSPLEGFMRRRTLARHRAMLLI